MKTQSSDTSLEAERVQIALLRQASVAERAGSMRALTRTVVQLSRHGIERAHKGADGASLRLTVLALTYGPALADRVAARMERMQLVSLAPDILSAVVPVVEAFDHYGVAYFIGGSVASSVYGMPRSTMDVDLVADLRPEQVQPLVERLQTAYYVDEQAMREAIDRRSSCNLIHLATMLKVDVFVPKARAFDREMFDRVHREQLIEGEAAQAFSLPSAEDMVLAKLEWYRLGGEASERQWTDVLGILKVQAPTLDTAYLRRWATLLNLADLLDRALDDAGLTGASQ